MTEQQDIKVIDTFSFNGEWVIRLRLEYLFPHVDEIVICESRYTHSGEKKPFLFKDKLSAWFEPYKSKIHWAIIEEFPKMTTEWEDTYKNHIWVHKDSRQAWFNDNYQRDFVISYIKEKYADVPYILNAGDVDEVPAIDIFQESVRQVMYDKLAEVDKPLYLEMLIFFYNFNWKKTYNWYRPYILRNDQLTDEQTLSYWRFNFRPTFVLREAGWHLSYFLEDVEIRRKLGSFSHREFDSKEWKSLSHIKKCIKEGEDIFDRNDTEKLVREDNLQFPDVFLSFTPELEFIQS